jgi:hypothetical protein
MGTSWMGCRAKCGLRDGEQGRESRGWKGKLITIEARDVVSTMSICS